MVDTTTMRISRDTAERLESQRVHPRETWDDIINRLLDELMDELIDFRKEAIKHEKTTN